MTSQTPSIPAREGIDARVAFAPGHVFFTRRIDLPEGLEKDDEQSFIELEVEKLSPFPLEHLNYGYKIDSSRKRAFVYAAYRRQLEDFDLKNAERLDAALPSFVFALLLDKPSERPLALYSADSLTYVEFDGQSELPSLMRSAPRDPESKERGLEGEGPALEDALEEGIRLSGCRKLQLDAGPTLSDKSMRLVVRDLETGAIETTRAPREEVWRLDLRDAETVAAARTVAKRNAALWKTVLGMAAFFALLLVGEAFWGLASGYAALRLHWNEAQAPAVARIDDMQRSVGELRQFQDSDLAPFDMLVAIEPYRTSQIVFSKVETDGPNVLRIDATTRNVSLANQFRARLQQMPGTVAVELVDMDNTAQGTVFTAVVEFVEGSFASSPREEAARRG